MSRESTSPGKAALPEPRLDGPAATVFAVAQELLARLIVDRGPVLAAAGGILAERLLAGGTVFVFGTGHSRAVAMELAARAGGLAGMHELVLDDLVTCGWATKSELLDGTLERKPEATIALLKEVQVGPGDAFVVISHSGCNGAPVEMALRARHLGLPVLAITSLEHSRAVTSRHPSGLRLFEVATMYIDTAAPLADTVISLGGPPGNPAAGRAGDRTGDRAGGTVGGTAGTEVGVCSVSTFAGVVIAQALTAEIVSCYLKAGVRPPVLQSRNLPGV
jgi:uncharacterized phosphosugar-binding protein